MVTVQLVLHQQDEDEDKDGGHNDPPDDDDHGASQELENVIRNMQTATLNVFSEVLDSALSITGLTFLITFQDLLGGNSHLGTQRQCSKTSTTHIQHVSKFVMNKEVTRKIQHTISK